VNILHLEASSGWGGQEIRILREMEGMRERGHTLVLAVARGGALAKRAKEAGFIVYELNFKRPAWLITLFSLLRILRRYKIDLLNTHSSLDSWIGGIAGRIAGKKIVRTRHLSTPIKKGLNSRLLYGKLADFVVTTCSSILPMISSQSGKSLHLCRSIPTGVDPEKIRARSEETLQFRTKLALDPDDFLIGTACSMRSWKGIDDLLKAAHILRDTPHLKWVIIGGGHAERHKTLARQLDLDHLVTFTGHLENPFPAIGALDLFALLSTAHEGVSQAILQAALLEKPLLATPIGGLNEVCIPEVTGIIVPPFSPEKVAEAVLRLKKNPKLRKEFGQQAQHLALTHFTFKQTLDEMEWVCKAALHN
jgi:glycosyltransferase involved in cell wall biosynthesis